MVLEEVRSDQSLRVWRAALIAVMDRVCPQDRSVARWKCGEQTCRVEPPESSGTWQTSGGERSSACWCVGTSTLLQTQGLDQPNLSRPPGWRD